MTTPFSSIWIMAFVCCCFVTSLVAKTPSTKEKSNSTGQTAEPTLKPEATSTPKPEQDEVTGNSGSSSNATILPGEIAEFRAELPRVRKLIESALDLTTRNLTYTANSDDPSNGGMDCSGFTAYVLRENGFPDVPRDASGQYIWVRKAGTFRAVLSQNPDTFELEDLRPGDLLFWIGTYFTDHDPPVTHTMIYLGTEKGTKNRIMAGSSDGRSYKGITRCGASVFDFMMNRHAQTPGSNPGPSRFVGYARPPGLRD